jgi:hypothetical protein
LPPPSGGAKFTAPSAAVPEGWGLYLSGEAARWFLGTTDAFYWAPFGCPQMFRHFSAMARMGQAVAFSCGNRWRKSER